MKKPLILLTAALLFLSGCSLYKNNESVAVPAILDSTSTVQIVQRAVNKIPNQKPFDDINSEGFVIWVAHDGYTIDLKPSPLTRTSVSFADETGGTVSPETGEKYGIIQAAVDEVLLHNDFVVNAQNSSADLKDDRFYDYVRGYENDKRNIVCTLTLNGDEMPVDNQPSLNTREVTFACSQDLQKAYNEQMPFLQTINITDRKNSIIAGIVAQSGDFLKVNVGFRRTGYFIIVKKEKNAYKLIFSGQEGPPCNIVKQYSIPKDIYLECYNPDGTLNTTL